MLVLVFNILINFEKINFRSKWYFEFNELVLAFPCRFFQNLSHPESTEKVECCGLVGSAVSLERVFWRLFQKTSPVYPYSLQMEQSPIHL